MIDLPFQRGFNHATDCCPICQPSRPTPPPENDGESSGDAPPSAWLFSRGTWTGLSADPEVPNADEYRCVRSFACQQIEIYKIIDRRLIDDCRTEYAVLWAIDWDDYVPILVPDRPSLTQLFPYIKSFVVLDALDNGARSPLIGEW